jgi:hypothetical protein
MPREAIALDLRVDYLSVLDEEGKVDKDLEPEIDDDLLRRIHRTMLLARRFDERMLKLQRQGRIGTFAPVSGQEAAQIGALAALRDDDWFVPAFREFAGAIWRGTPLTQILVYNGGYNEGGAVPEDAHDLPIAIPVATQIPHAVGIAYAAQYRKTDQVAWCGLTEDSARNAGREVEVVRFPWRASGRALTTGAEDGLTKLIAEPESGRLLGAGIVGRGAEDLIAEAVLAIEMGALAEDVALSIHPHPTLSETVGEAGELFFGASTHLARGRYT